MSSQDTLRCREAHWRDLIRSMGQHIKEARLALGWSQQELGDRSWTSQGTISRFESGRCAEVPLLSALKILSALSPESALVAGALGEPTRAILALARGLEIAQGSPVAPHFAKLLRVFHALNPDQQEVFVTLAAPIAEALK